MLYTKRIISIIALLFSICILFSSCGSSSVIFTNDNIFNAINEGEKYHTFSAKTETVAKNEFIELGIDKTNHSIVVKDIQENYTWNSLPDKNNDTAYAFGLTLHTKKGVYNLNTQDNSVAFSASSYKIKDGVLTVDYMLSDNQQTAGKNIEDMTEDDIFVSFSAVYTMKNQSVKLRIDLSGMKCTKGAFISEFIAMPCFGSAYTDSANDYFLIPDNSGAVMHLSKKDAPTDNITVNVYGENPYNPSGTDVASATVPVFGVKRNTSAFAAVITGGDALAVINASRSNNDSPSAVYSEFIITEVKNETVSENSFKITHGSSYNGDISIVYKFLSGGNANYSGMASASREEFITNGVLSSSKTEPDNNIPFCLTVVGEADGSSLTTINQANDILGILKGKGVSNIHLNYKGLLSGGLAQNNLYNSKINRKLGGNDGLEDLYNYTQKQNCTFMLGANIFSSARNYSPLNKSLTIEKNNAAFSMKNDLSFNEKASSSLLTRIGADAYNLGKEKMDQSIYSPTSEYIMNLFSIRKMNDKFQTYLEKNILSSVDGISVSDAGRILYSDKKTDRQTARNTVSSLLRAVSNYGQLSIEGGNIYTLYNADMITEMELDTFWQESENYESVPFVQSILHGNVLYTGLPIDAGNPLYRYEMLRFIEYGALPSYEWIYANENVFCYSGYLLSERITEVVEFYNDATNILSDLADDTIVKHKKIEKDANGNAVTGVYCTTYSDGSEIYVNYTGSIVSTDENIAVGPYDYVKVKR